MLTTTQPNLNFSVPYYLNNRREAVCEASDEGYNTGKEKKRLKISPLDHINKFALAITEKKDAFKELENITWVYLNTKKGPVEISIASILKRLPLNEDEVQALASQKSQLPINDFPFTNALDAWIQDFIEKYETDVLIVTNFTNLMAANLNDIDTIKNILLKNHLKKHVANTAIRNFCNAFIEKCLTKIATHDTAKTDFSELFDYFLSGLIEIDENFSPDIVDMPDRIIENCTLWKNTDIEVVDLGNEKLVVGLHLVNNSERDLRYAIKTDGYIYYEQPKMKSGWVPFTKDGKKWVQISLKPLSLYTGIDSKVLENAALDKSGANKLKGLIDEKLASMNKGIFYFAFNLDFPIGEEPYKDIAQEIFSYLSLGDLNALSRVNRQYKPDVDLARLAIARKNGLDINDLKEACSHLKQLYQEIYGELMLLCEQKIFPSRWIVYNNLIFDRKVLGKETLNNFKKFSDDELFELFENDLLYIPFFSKICSELIRLRGAETLILAATYGRADILTKLLDNGVNCNIHTKKGNSLLHIAAYYGQEEILKILLKKDIKPDCINHEGETPLFYAHSSEKNGTYLVKLLLSHGADPNFKRNDGKTPLEVARDK